MRSDVDSAWDAIVAWLARNSPGELALVRPPAAAADLRHADSVMGSALPDDLVAWWRRADGQEGGGRLLPGVYSPYPVRQALRSREIWMSAWNGVMEQHAPVEFAAYVAGQERAPAGSPGKDAWLPSWLPIAGNGGGSDLFVDLRPGPARGCVRRFVRDDGAGDRVLWTGVGAMLAEVADALATGSRIDQHRVWVEDGRIWWDLESSRWAEPGKRSVDVAALRAGYTTFLAEVRAGGFGPPPAGGWSAEQVAAHVLRNTELLVATSEALLARPVDPPPAPDLAGQPGRMRAARPRAERFADAHGAGAVRYDNSDAMDPATLDRYAALGPATLADRIEPLAERLCVLADRLDGARPVAHVHVVDAGATVIDQRAGWLGVLNALSRRQLPLRVRQLRALR